MTREPVLAKILALMQDGEPRTVRRIHRLTSVSLNTVRKAVREGYLIKVGEEPCPVFYARHGQAILQIAAPRHVALS
jgi:hypothetical protein